jgi:nicotinamide mononucleotide (NMN) deamidase PncC
VRWIGISPRRGNRCVQSRHQFAGKRNLNRSRTVGRPDFRHPHSLPTYARTLRLTITKSTLHLLSSHGAVRRSHLHDSKQWSTQNAQHTNTSIGVGVSGTRTPASSTSWRDYVLAIANEATSTIGCAIWQQWLQPQ